MKNLLVPLFISMILFFSACKPPQKECENPTARVLTAKFEINDKIVVKCDGKPCIYNTKKPISLLSKDQSDPLNVGINNSPGNQRVASASPETPETRNIENGLCSCDRNEPCDPQSDNSCPNCRTDCGPDINPPDPGEFLASTGNPIFNEEDIFARFLGPKVGLIDDYIAFSVNKISTARLAKIYTGATFSKGANDTYFVVRDIDNNYVAVVGTQDPNKTLIMRSPSLALLAVGGIQNTTLGGKPIIPMGKR